MTNHDQLFQCAQAMVMQCIGEEPPGEGLTVVMDLRHRLGLAVAHACGLSQEQVDSQLYAASEHHVVPFFVGWLTVDGALELFATQGGEAQREVERLQARARREGSHVVAIFHAAETVVTVMLIH